MTEIRVDRLLGRRVYARNNRRVGRIEEFRVEKRGSGWVIVAYVLGSAGLLERLDVGLRLLLGSKRHNVIARWDQMDISDPDRPRLRCGAEELRPAEISTTRRPSR
jgi:hypothetical protein